MIRPGTLLAPALFVWLAGCGGPASEPGNTVENVAAPAAAAIADRYTGTWDSSAAACARSMSEMRLVITPAALRFYEGAAKVQRVAREGEEAIVAATLESEGMTEERQYRLALTGDGALRVTTGDTTTTRVRC